MTELCGTAESDTGAMMINPYYSEPGIEIYHGDCRDILPHLPKVDLVLTDPPYGVEMGTSKEKRAGRIIATEKYESYDDNYSNFILEIIPAISMALRLSSRAAIFSGPHFQDYPKADVLGGIYCPSANGRHKWGFNTFLPILFYGTNPNQHNGCRSATLQSTATTEKCGHPCPKPIQWIRWLVNFASLSTDTILDPFMGSGTTLVAAKQLGRKAIGIEIEKKYCDIAIDRLRQEVLPLNQPEHIEEQEALL